MNQLLQKSHRKRKLDPLDHALRSNAVASRCEKDIYLQNFTCTTNRGYSESHREFEDAATVNLDTEVITLQREVPKEFDIANKASSEEDTDDIDNDIYSDDIQTFDMFEFSSLSVLDDIDESQTMSDLDGKEDSSTCNSVDGMKDPEAINGFETYSSEKQETNHKPYTKAVNTTPDVDETMDIDDKSDSFEDEQEDTSDDADDEDEEDEHGQNDFIKTSRDSSKRHHNKRYHKDIERRIKRHIEEIEHKMAILKSKEQKKRKRSTKCKKSTTKKTEHCEPLPKMKIHPIKRTKRLAQPIRCAVLKRHTLKNALRGWKGSCCGKGCWSRWAWVNMKRVLSDYW